MSPETWNIVRGGLLVGITSIVTTLVNFGLQMLRESRARTWARQDTRLAARKEFEERHLYTPVISALDALLEQMSEAELSLQEIRIRGQLGMSSDEVVRRFDTSFSEMNRKARVLFSRIHAIGDADIAQSYVELGERHKRFVQHLKCSEFERAHVEAGEMCRIAGAILNRLGYVGYVLFEDSL